MTGNVCRKGLKFPVISGNLNWWNCHVILMTINKAYLVALRATVPITYISLITPGLYDTFPGPPETFPGHIRWFPGQFHWNIDILRQINHRFSGFVESFCVSSNMFPGSPNRIPGPPGTPDTFPGHIGSFPWLLLMVILIFYLHSIEPI